MEALSLADLRGCMQKTPAALTPQNVKIQGGGEPKLCIKFTFAVSSHAPVHRFTNAQASNFTSVPTNSRPLIPDGFGQGHRPVHVRAALLPAAGAARLRTFLRSPAAAPMERIEGASKLGDAFIILLLAQLMG